MEVTTFARSWFKVDAKDTDAAKAAKNAWRDVSDEERDTDELMTLARPTPTDETSERDAEYAIVRS